MNIATVESKGWEAIRERKRLPFILEVLRRLVREKPLGLVGGVIVLGMLITAILADVIAPYGYNQAHPAYRLAGYTNEFWLGTDSLGRDLLSRVIHGSRISMYVGLGAVGIGTTAATVLGVITGYFGGKVDAVLQRIVDAWMSFPWLVILLAIMALLGPGLINVIIALALGYTFGSSRVVRGAVISVKEETYIEAGRAIGCGHLRIIFQYILPNVMAPIIIIATLGLGSAILAESALSFLGLGIPPPVPSWGQMLSGTGLLYMYDAPWLALWPGLAISLAVFGFNMLGDALRDLLDPRLRGGGAGRYH